MTTGPETPRPAQSFITIVSGYPRSGTSLMMQMLEAGGMPVLHDKSFRPPDEHNPRGYYESEAAADLGVEGSTTDWLLDARGSAVKVMAYRLRLLPTDLDYRVVFMRRRIAEVLASTGDFSLIRDNVTLSESEAVLAYKTEYLMYEAWLAKQDHLSATFIDYNALIDSPSESVETLCAFLGLTLDRSEMIAVVDPTLYRHRR